MSSVLYITANPKPVDLSASLRVGQAFLKAYKELHPEDTIQELDLYAGTFQDIDYEILRIKDKQKEGQELELEERLALKGRRHLLDQFKQADKYIIACPVWNFDVPARLKAYIDVVVEPDETFSRAEDGSLRGLLTGKKALLILAAGGYCKSGEFASPLLHRVFDFMGISDFSGITVLGTDTTELHTVVDQAILVQMPSVLERF